VDGPSVRTLSREGPLLSTDGWNPEAYARFAAERRRPFEDLLGLVAPIPGGRAVDLGCGPGTLTRVLHEKVGAASTVGIDSSDAMLAKAAAHAGRGVAFDRGDIGSFEPAKPFELVFSNAALHWVPDHPALLERLTRAVAAGGQLAFQVPDNFDHPSHRTAEEIAAREPFRSALADAKHSRHVLAPEAYATLLDRLGYFAQNVRLQIYGQSLPSREGIVAWVDGSLLSEYRRRLSPELYLKFLEEYRNALFARVPDERPFFFTYRRILAWARKGTAA
jgi:trans-aconitate 2-methyltransferase